MLINSNDIYRLWKIITDMDDVESNICEKYKNELARKLARQIKTQGLPDKNDPSKIILDSFTYQAQGLLTNNGYAVVFKVEPFEYKDTSSSIVNKNAKEKIEQQTQQKINDEKYEKEKAKSAKMSILRYTRNMTGNNIFAKWQILNAIGSLRKNKKYVHVFDISDLSDIFDIKILKELCRLGKADLIFSKTRKAMCKADTIISKYMALPLSEYGISTLKQVITNQGIYVWSTINDICLTRDPNSAYKDNYLDLIDAQLLLMANKPVEMKPDLDTTMEDQIKEAAAYIADNKKYNVQMESLKLKIAAALKAVKIELRKDDRIQELITRTTKYVNSVSEYKQLCKNKASVAKVVVGIESQPMRDALTELFKFAADL